MICPNCKLEIEPEFPDEPWFAVYICDECGFEDSEDMRPDLVDKAMYEMEDR